MVNLQYIQTYPKKFLSKLSKRFSLEKNKEYIPILYHTKTQRKNIQNETYKKYPVLTEKEYQKFINKKVENEINNITITYIK